MTGLTPVGIIAAMAGPPDRTGITDEVVVELHRPEPAEQVDEQENDHGDD